MKDKLLKNNQLTTKGKQRIRNMFIFILGNKAFCKPNLDEEQEANFTLDYLDMGFWEKVDSNIVLPHEIMNLDGCSWSSIRNMELTISYSILDSEVIEVLQNFLGFTSWRTFLVSADNGGHIQVISFKWGNGK